MRLSVEESEVTVWSEQTLALVSSPSMAPPTGDAVRPARTAGRTLWEARGEAFKMNPVDSIGMWCPEMATLNPEEVSFSREWTAFVEKVTRESRTVIGGDVAIVDDLDLVDSDAGSRRCCPRSC